MGGDRGARNCHPEFLLQGWAWRCAVAVATAAALLLLSSSPVRAQLFDDAELEQCVFYINLADENKDNFLDESDFFRLIERFAMDLNCATAYENGNEFTLTDTQRDKFMELACPCLALPLDDQETSCCAPENQKIDVQVIAKGWEALSDSEKVEPMLLCGHAENLVSDFDCTNSPQNQMPSQHPSNEPTAESSAHPSNEPTPASSERPSNEPTPAPTAHPSNEPTPASSERPSNEPTPAPTKKPSEEPSDELTPAPSDKPTTVGDEFPQGAADTPRDTAFPSLDVIAEDPPTNSPIGGPTVSPTKEPTESPVRDPTARPTTRPTLAPEDKPISTGYPTLNPIAATPSPTRKALDETETCIEAMKVADVGDMVLSSDEYTVFLQKLSGCSDLASQSLQQFGAFQTLVCACSTFKGEFPSCCESKTQIDISAAYKSRQDRSDEETRLVEFICTTSANVLPPEGECGGALPTSAPVSDITVTTPAPVDQPLATGFPTLNLKVKPPSSTTAPTTIGDEFPPSSPVALPPDVQTDDACLAALVQANTDGDTALTQDEYLKFTQILANCPSISSLSVVQVELFLTYSVPRPTIDIAAAYQTEEERSQVDSIRLVSFCSAHRLTISFDECTAPPTDSPVKAPSSQAPTIIGDEFPSPPSPAGGNADCLQALKDADSSGSGVLSSDEYTMFLRYLSGCPELTLNEQQFGAFQTLVCACSTFAGEFPSCCASSSQIDVSVVYRNQQDLSDADTRLIAFICLTSANVMPGVGECDTTPAPVDQPAATGFPSLNVVGEQPSTSPTKVGDEFPPSSPVTEIDEPCFSAMLDADADEDKALTRDEFIVFTQIFTNCPSVLSLSIVQFGLFVAYSVPRSTIDIAAAYEATDGLSVVDAVRLNALCTAHRLTHPFVNCISPVDPPTAKPATNAPATQVPLPPIDNEDPPSVETEAPTVPPTNNEDPPSVETETPTDISEEFPTGITPIATGFPELNVEEPEDDFVLCIEHLLAANSDSNDILLDRSEYLSFMVLQSNCDLITSLSQAQMDAFRLLACKCLELEITSQNCCANRNARVSIDGAALPPDSRSQDQEDALRDVCSVTAGVIPATCSPPPPTPAPTSPPAPASTGRPVTSDSSRRPITSEPTLRPVVTLERTQSPIAPSAAPTQPPATEQPTKLPTTTPITSPPSFKPIFETERPIEVVTTAAPGTTEAKLPTDAPLDTQAPIPPVATVPDPTESPVVPPTFELSSSCISAILASDVDMNGFLSESEYISFVQILSQCEKISVLSKDLKNAYRDLWIRGCGIVPQERLLECWINQLGIYVDPASKIAESRTSIQTNFLAEICQVTDDATPDECVAPPTMAPTISLHPTVSLQAGDVDDFEFCTEQLESADKSTDEALDHAEYLEFLRHYGQCTDLTYLNIGHQAVFLTLASGCAEANCALTLPGNAKLNISGAAISGDNRTRNEESRLLRICETAIGLTNGDKCVKPPVVLPLELSCASSLVASDSNSDGGLNKEEYLSFMRREYSKCAQLSSLSLVQNVVWNVLACSCMFEPGAGIECCFSGDPKVEISGAGLPADEMSDEESSFISSICRASNATVEVGCQETLWTPAPSLKSQGETFSTSAPSPAPSKNGVRASRSSYMQLDFALLATLCVSITASIFWG